MANLQAISKTQYSDKKWQRFPDYGFTAKDAVCPLIAQEIPKAMANMTIAFLCLEDNYSLVAVQGLNADTNLYVDAKGKWLGKYIPACYRSYPFMLAANAADEGKLVLCIDEDSGLVNDDHAEEVFFGENGELSDSVQAVLKFLTELQSGRQATSRICDVLQEYNLLKPWGLQIQLEKSAHKVEGLFCIDEVALNELSDEDFITLRQAHALPIIYSQLLSMQHIAVLANATQARTKLSGQAQAGELNFDAIGEDGNISFDNL